MKNRRGVTLIMVAAVLAILAALATGFYTMMVMQTRSAVHYSDTVRARLERLLPYNPTFMACLGVAAFGALAAVPLIRTYAANGFVLRGLGIQTHWAVMGLWLIIAAFETFIFALMVRALGIALPTRRRAGG